MRIGDRIKTKREELGFTQQEIVDQLFVSRPHFAISLLHLPHPYAKL